MKSKILNLMRMQRQMIGNFRGFITQSPEFRANNKWMKRLTIKQVLALTELNTIAPCSLSELSHKMNISLPTTSLLVNSLVEKEVLIREQDPSDRRRIILRLEPEAREFVNTMEEATYKIFAEIVDEIGADAANQWYELLMKINGVIEDKKRKTSLTNQIHTTDQNIIAGEARNE